MRMFARIRNLMWTLLGQVPTLLTLALLGGIAWWGYIWDWKIPTLPELLDPAAARSRAERGNEEKKSEEESQQADRGGEKSLPLVQLPSEEKMTEAGIKTEPVKERLIDEYVTAHGH